MNKEQFEELFKKKHEESDKVNLLNSDPIDNLKTYDSTRTSIPAGTVEIEGVKLHLSHPDEVPMKWVGQEELKIQLKAAWLVLHENDYPLNPRLLGKPGVGKTTLAYSTAKELNKEVYIFQATMDTRPEDLLISPVITSNQQIKYVASSLVTAMIRGGVIILDEGNRMSEKSWASLAPLLDGRRYIESIVAGIKVSAHPDFRFVATMNDDASTFEIPEYIHSRLQPQIMIDFPEKDEELMILKENLPFMKQRILEYIVDFLQKAHRKDERYTVRDGINIARYAGKLIKAKNLPESQALKNAVIQVLGQEALIHLQTEKSI
jgi:MoxR-like ATPase